MSMSNILNPNHEPAPFPMDPVKAPDVHVKADPVAESLTRMERARRAVESVGIDWPATIVPEGSALIAVGTAKLKRDRAAWERMPLAVNALPVVKDALAAEQRQDYTERIAGLRLRPSDGRIVRAESIGADPHVKPGLAYTDHALRQLLGQAGILDGAPKGFASALAYVNNAERAAVVNRLIVDADPGKETVLRTRLPHAGSARVVRAALSERYGDANDEHLADMFASAGLPDGARLSYMPGDSASRFEVVLPSLIPIDAIRAGDVHKAGIIGRNSETGQGGADILGVITRILCVNLTLADAHGEVTSIRHVGDQRRVHAKIRAALRAAMTQIGPLLDVIGYSAAVTLDGWTVAEAFKAIAARYGEGKSAAEAWTAQHKASSYPDTVWGVTSAITEAAHERDSWTASEDWERIGSWVTDGAVKAVKSGQTWAEILKVRGDEARDMQRLAAMANRTRGN